MRNFIKYFFIFALVNGFAVLHAEDKDHSAKESKEEHSGHGEEEEGGGNVGPEKGIIEASPAKGFKLSPEALKNFEIKTVKLAGDGPWPVLTSAIVHSGEETNLMRLRSGFFKSIDFQVIRQTPSGPVVESDDMREGDEIVVSGLGFLKISELAAFGGVAHGHSH